MIAIYETSSGALREIVYSLDGVELEGCSTLQAADHHERDQYWDESIPGWVKGVASLEKVRAESEIDQRANAAYREVLQSDVIATKLHPAKRAEADRFLAAVSPEPNEFPLLQAEVGITAETLEEVARAVLAKPHQEADLIVLAGVLIEPIRLQASKAVQRADSLHEIRHILSGLSFPSVL